MFVTYHDHISIYNAKVYIVRIISASTSGPYSIYMGIHGIHGRASDSTLKLLHLHIQQCGCFHMSNDIGIPGMYGMVSGTIVISSYTTSKSGSLHITSAAQATFLFPLMNDKSIPPTLDMHLYSAHRFQETY